jgi:hypothetical protein
MPCMCWFDPPEASKKLIKEYCQKLVFEIRELEKDGDPLGCTMKDIHILLDDLYSGKCQEKNDPST